MQQKKQAIHEDLINQIRDNLTPDLLKPEFRDQPFPVGHCYVSSEALYHLLGGRESGLRPMRLRMPDGVVHWWLETPEGEVIDPTHDQFGESVPYEQGKSGGFLTREPSRRATELMNRISSTESDELAHNLMDELAWVSKERGGLDKSNFLGDDSPERATPYVILNNQMYVAPRQYHYDLADYLEKKNGFTREQLRDGYWGWIRPNENTSFEHSDMLKDNNWHDPEMVKRLYPSAIDITKAPVDDAPSDPLKGYEQRRSSSWKESVNAQGWIYDPATDKFITGNTWHGGLLEQLFDKPWPYIDRSELDKLVYGWFGHPASGKDPVAIYSDNFGSTATEEQKQRGLQLAKEYYEENAAQNIESKVAFETEPDPPDPGHYVVTFVYYADGTLETEVDRSHAHMINEYIAQHGYDRREFMLNMMPVLGWVFSIDNQLYAVFASQGYNVQNNTLESEREETLVALSKRFDKPVRETDYQEWMANQQWEAIVGESSVQKTAFDQAFVYANDHLYVANKPHPAIMRANGIDPSTPLVAGIIKDTPTGDGPLWMTFFSWSQNFDDPELQDRARQAIEHEYGKFPTEVSYDDMVKIDNEIGQHRNEMRPQADNRMNERWDDHEKACPFVWMNGMVWIGDELSGHNGFATDRPDMYAEWSRLMNESEHTTWSRDQRDALMWFGRVFPDGEVVAWNDQPVPENIQNDIRNEAQKQGFEMMSAALPHIYVVNTGDSYHQSGLPFIYVPDNDAIYLGETMAPHIELIKNNEDLNGYVRPEEYTTGNGYLAGRIDRNGDVLFFNVPGSVYNPQTEQTVLTTLKSQWPAIQDLDGLQEEDDDPINNWPGSHTYPVHSIISKLANEEPEIIVDPSVNNSHIPDFNQMEVIYIYDPGTNKLVISRGLHAAAIQQYFGGPRPEDRQYGNMIAGYGSLDAGWVCVTGDLLRNDWVTEQVDRVLENISSSDHVASVRLIDIPVTGQQYDWAWNNGQRPILYHAPSDTLYVGTRNRHHGELIRQIYNQGQAEADDWDTLQNNKDYLLGSGLPSGETKWFTMRDSERNALIPQANQQWQDYFTHRTAEVQVQNPVSYNYVPLTPNELTAFDSLDERKQTTYYRQAQRLNARAEKAGVPGKIRGRDLAALMYRYDGRCAYDGTPGADSFDHVIPLSRGGSNTVDNLLPAHTQCNAELNDWDQKLTPIPTAITLSPDWLNVPAVAKVATVVKELLFTDDDVDERDGDRHWAKWFYYAPTDTLYWWPTTSENDGMPSHAQGIKEAFPEEDWLEMWDSGDLTFGYKTPDQLYAYDFNDRYPEKDIHAAQIASEFFDMPTNLSPERFASSNNIQFVDTEGGMYHGMGFPFLYDIRDDILYFGTTSTYHVQLLQDMQANDQDYYDDYKGNTKPLVGGRYNPEENPPDRIYLYNYRNDPIVSNRIRELVNEAIQTPEFQQIYENDSHHMSAWNPGDTAWVYDPETKQLHSGQYHGEIIRSMNLPRDYNWDQFVYGWYPRTDEEFTDSYIAPESVDHPDEQEALVAAQREFANRTARTAGVVYLDVPSTGFGGMNPEDTYPAIYDPEVDTLYVGTLPETSHAELIRNSPLGHMMNDKGHGYNMDHLGFAWIYPTQDPHDPGYEAVSWTAAIPSKLLQEAVKGLRTGKTSERKEDEAHEQLQLDTKVAESQWIMSGFYWPDNNAVDISMPGQGHTGLMAEQEYTSEFMRKQNWVPFQVFHDSRDKFYYVVVGSDWVNGGSYDLPPEGEEAIREQIQVNTDEPVYFEGDMVTSKVASSVEYVHVPEDLRREWEPDSIRGNARPWLLVNDTYYIGSLGTGHAELVYAGNLRDESIDYSDTGVITDASELLDIYGYRSYPIQGSKFFVIPFNDEALAEELARLMIDHTDEMIKSTKTALQNHIPNPGYTEWDSRAGRYAWVLLSDGRILFSKEGGSHQSIAVDHEFGREYDSFGKGTTYGQLFDKNGEIEVEIFTFTGGGSNQPPEEIKEKVKAAFMDHKDDSWYGKVAMPGGGYCYLCYNDPKIKNKQGMHPVTHWDWVIDELHPDPKPSQIGLCDMHHWILQTEGIDGWKQIFPLRRQPVMSSTIVEVRTLGSAEEDVADSRPIIYDPETDTIYIGGYGGYHSELMDSEEMGGKNWRGMAFGRFSGFDHFKWYMNQDRIPDLANVEEQIQAEARVHSNLAEQMGWTIEDLGPSDHSHELLQWDVDQDRLAWVADLTTKTIYIGEGWMHREIFKRMLNMNIEHAGDMSFSGLDVDDIAAGSTMEDDPSKMEFYEWGKNWDQYELNELREILQDYITDDHIKTAVELDKTEAGWPSGYEWYTSWLYVPDTGQLLIKNKRDVNHTMLIVEEPQLMQEIREGVEIVPGLILKNNHNQYGILSMYSDKWDGSNILHPGANEEAVKAVQDWAAANTHWGDLPVVNTEDSRISSFNHINYVNVPEFNYHGDGVPWILLNNGDIYMATESCFHRELIWAIDPDDNYKNISSNIAAAGRVENGVVKTYWGPDRANVSNEVLRALKEGALNEDERGKIATVVDDLSSQFPASASEAEEPWSYWKYIYDNDTDTLHVWKTKYEDGDPIHAAAFREIFGPDTYNHNFRNSEARFAWGHGYENGYELYGHHSTPDVNAHAEAALAYFINSFQQETSKTAGEYTPMVKGIRGRWILLHDGTVLSDDDPGTIHAQILLDNGATPDQIKDIGFDDVSLRKYIDNYYTFYNNVKQDQERQRNSSTDQWDNIQPVDDSCYLVAADLSHEYPELHYEAGQYGDQGEHAWLRMDDGTIIDPTHGQYDESKPMNIVKPNDPAQKLYKSWATNPNMTTDWNNYPEEFMDDPDDPLHWLFRGKPGHPHSGPDEFDGAMAPKTAGWEQQQLNPDAQYIWVRGNKTTVAAPTWYSHGSLIQWLRDHNEEPLSTGNMSLGKDLPANTVVLLWEDDETGDKYSKASSTVTVRDDPHPKSFIWTYDVNKDHFTVGNRDWYHTRYWPSTDGGVVCGGVNPDGVWSYDDSTNKTTPSEAKALMQNLLDQGLQEQLTNKTSAVVPNPTEPWNDPAWLKQWQDREDEGGFYGDHREIANPYIPFLVMEDGRTWIGWDYASHAYEWMVDEAEEELNIDYNAMKDSQGSINFADQEYEVHWPNHGLHRELEQQIVTEIVNDVEDERKRAFERGRLDDKTAWVKTATRVDVSNPEDLTQWRCGLWVYDEKQDHLVLAPYFSHYPFHAKLIRDYMWDFEPNDRDYEALVAGQWWLRNNDLVVAEIYPDDNEIEGPMKDMIEGYISEHLQTETTAGLNGDLPDNLRNIPLTENEGWWGTYITDVPVSTDRLSRDVLTTSPTPLSRRDEQLTHRNSAYINTHESQGLTYTSSYASDPTTPHEYTSNITSALGLDTMRHTNTPIGKYPHQGCPSRVPPWHKREYLSANGEVPEVEDTGARTASDTPWWVVAEPGEEPNQIAWVADLNTRTVYVGEWHGEIFKSLMGLNYDHTTDEQAEETPNLATGRSWTQFYGTEMSREQIKEMLQAIHDYYEQRAYHFSTDIFPRVEDIQASPNSKLTALFEDINGTTAFAWSPEQLIQGHNHRFIIMKIRDQGLDPNDFTYGWKNGDHFYIHSWDHQDFQAEHQILECKKALEAMGLHDEDGPSFQDTGKVTGTLEQQIHPGWGGQSLIYFRGKQYSAPTHAQNFRKLIGDGASSEEILHEGIPGARYLDPGAQRRIGKVAAINEIPVETAGMHPWGDEPFIYYAPTNTVYVATKSGRHGDIMRWIQDHDPETFALITDRSTGLDAFKNIFYGEFVPLHEWRGEVESGEIDYFTASGSRLTSDEVPEELKQWAEARWGNVTSKVIESHPSLHIVDVDNYSSRIEGLERPVLQREGDSNLYVGLYGGGHWDLASVAGIPFDNILTQGWIDESGEFNAYSITTEAYDTLENAGYNPVSKNWERTIEDKVESHLSGIQLTQPNEPRDIDNPGVRWIKTQDGTYYTDEEEPVMTHAHLVHRYKIPLDKIVDVGVDDDSLWKYYSGWYQNHLPTDFIESHKTATQLIPIDLDDSSWHSEPAWIYDPNKDLLYVSTGASHHARLFHSILGDDYGDTDAMKTGWIDLDNNYVAFVDEDEESAFANNITAIFSRYYDREMKPIDGNTWMAKYGSIESHKQGANIGEPDPNNQGKFMEGSQPFIYYNGDFYWGKGAEHHPDILRTNMLYGKTPLLAGWVNFRKKEIGLWSGNVTQDRTIEDEVARQLQEQFPDFAIDKGFRLGAVTSWKIEVLPESTGRRIDDRVAWVADQDSHTIYIGDGWFHGDIFKQIGELNVDHAGDLHWRQDKTSALLAGSIWKNNILLYGKSGEWNPSDEAEVYDTIKDWYREERSEDVSTHQLPNVHAMYQQSRVMDIDDPINGRPQEKPFSFIYYNGDVFVGYLHTHPMLVSDMAGMGIKILDKANTAAGWVDTANRVGMFYSFEQQWLNRSSEEIQQIQANEEDAKRQLESWVPGLEWVNPNDYLRRTTATEWNYQSAFWYSPRTGLLTGKAAHWQLIGDALANLPYEERETIMQHSYLGWIFESEGGKEKVAVPASVEHNLDPTLEEEAREALKQEGITLGDPQPGMFQFDSEDYPAEDYHLGRLATEVVDIPEVEEEDYQERTRRKPFVYSPREDKLYIGPYGSHHVELIWKAFGMNDDPSTPGFDAREEIAMNIEDDPGNLGVILVDQVTNAPYLVHCFGDPSDKCLEALRSTFPGVRIEDENCEVI